MHIDTNNKLYSYNMNNATLKQLMWREIYELLLIRMENIWNSVYWKKY